MDNFLCNRTSLQMKSHRIVDAFDSIEQKKWNDSLNGENSNWWLVYRIWSAHKWQWIAIPISNIHQTRNTEYMYLYSNQITFTGVGRPDTL